MRPSQTALEVCAKIDFGLEEHLHGRAPVLGSTERMRAILYVGDKAAQRSHPRATIDLTSASRTSSDGDDTTQRAPLEVGPRMPGLADARTVFLAGTDSPRRGRSAKDPHRSFCGRGLALLRVVMPGRLRGP
jgi:hypothetical protein